MSQGAIRMVDDLIESKPGDSNRVVLHQQREVSYWSQVFGVTPEQLRQAVHTVGNSAHAVREYFERQRGR
jgi:hypothetical protein